MRDDCCGRHPHASSCPYAPEPTPEGECAACGEDVFDWEDYAEFGGEYIHLDCAKEYLVANADSVHINY